MTGSRTFAAATVAVGVIAVAHAILTWPRFPTVALFGGGGLIAFVAEALVINRGWLEHHIGPKIVGVPPYLLFGWTGIVYLTFRSALLVTEGWLAVALTGVLATSYDVLTDDHGVADGHWTYIDTLPGPRYRGVPWWNYLGWLGISCLTAAITLPFL